MITLSIDEARPRLQSLCDEAMQGEAVFITSSGSKLVLMPCEADEEETNTDDPALEAALLAAIEGPHSPYRKGEFTELTKQIIAARQTRAAS